MEKNTITWGMIGCGDVTEVKNGPGLYLAQNSQLKGIWNRTKEKATNWVLRHKQGRVYDSVEELLADQEIDIVYIATTPDKHKEYALLCAKAGKHCLIEKPLATTLSDGIEIQKAFHVAGKKAFVAFYRRSMNRFQKVKDLLDTGAIGTVQMFSVTRAARSETDQTQWRMQPTVSGGNIFTETDIHMFDFFDQIFGEVSSFDAVTASLDNECNYFDSISMNLFYKSGVIGSGSWNYHCSQPVDLVTIIGENGRISFDFFHNDKPVILTNSQETKEFIIEDSCHVGMKMEQEIVNELLGTGTFSGTIDAAVRTLAIMDAVVRQSEEKRK